MNASRFAWIVVHALVGWALCTATIAAGMALTTTDNALLAHAIAAPLIFIALSWLFFHRFPDAPPIATAIEFVAIVMAMDFFVVALLFLQSLAMFASLIGTWIPFALILGGDLCHRALAESPAEAGQPGSACLTG